MPVTNYIWDVVSDNVLMEKDDDDETIARYVQEPELYGEVISQERDGETRHYHYDGEGNTSELTDDEQNVTDRFEYSAFGEEIARTGTTENPFGYKGALGYYTNGETNDIYIRARTYEPIQGRWLSTDPLGHVDSANMYEYGHNDPVRSSDPTGLLTVTEQYREIGPNGFECGTKASVTWKFTLTRPLGIPPQRPPVCDGYIVQRLEVWCKSIRCSTFGGICPNDQLGPPDKVLYEAFEIKKPGLWFTTDTGEVSAPPATCGHLQVRGTVKFYCKDPQPPFSLVGTGDLGGFSRSGMWLTGKRWEIPGCLQHIDITTMPSTDEQPKWWNSKPIEGPATRNIFAYWKCCGCSSTWEPKLSYSPSASNAP